MRSFNLRGFFPSWQTAGLNPFINSITRRGYTDLCLYWTSSIAWGLKVPKSVTWAISHQLPYLLAVSPRAGYYVSGCPLPPLKTIGGWQQLHLPSYLSQEFCKALSTEHKGRPTGALLNKRNLLLFPEILISTVGAVRLADFFSVPGPCGLT